MTLESPLRISEDKEDEDKEDEQKEWVKRRLKGPAWSWDCWDGRIEEWQPWSRIDYEFINIWRIYKK